MAKFIIKTPVGELKYAFITQGRDESEKQDGTKWKKSIAFRCHKDSEEAKYLIGLIDEAWQDYVLNTPAIKKTPPKSLGYKLEKLEDGSLGEHYLFQFKTNKFLPSGQEAMIPIYNINGQPVKMEKGTMIGNGTIGCVFGTAGGYTNKGNYGITLYLTGIQIVKFVAYQANLNVSDLSQEVDEAEAFTGFGDGIPVVENDEVDL